MRESEGEREQREQRSERPAHNKNLSLTKQSAVRCRHVYSHRKPRGDETNLRCRRRGSAHLGADASEPRAPGSAAKDTVHRSRRRGGGGERGSGRPAPLGGSLPVRATEQGGKVGERVVGRGRPAAGAAVGEGEGPGSRRLRRSRRRLQEGEKRRRRGVARGRRGRRCAGGSGAAGGCVAGARIAGDSPAPTSCFSGGARNFSGERPVRQEEREESARGATDGPGKVRACADGAERSREKRHQLHVDQGLDRRKNSWPGPAAPQRGPRRPATGAGGEACKLQEGEGATVGSPGVLLGPPGAEKRRDVGRRAF